MGNSLFFYNSYFLGMDHEIHWKIFEKPELGKIIEKKSF